MHVVTFNVIFIRSLAVMQYCVIEKRIRNEPRPFID